MMTVLAIAVNVLQNMKDMVISHSYFAEEGYEM